METSVRTLLLALYGFGALGLGAELVLLEHYESALQWIPLVSLTVGVAAALALALRPSPATVRVFRWLGVAFLVVGATGLFLHYRENSLFELEMDPAMGGVALLWAALRGATPALAPGAMVQLGLIGLIAAYRHPAVQEV